MKTHGVMLEFQLPADIEPKPEDVEELIGGFGEVIRQWMLRKNYPLACNCPDCAREKLRVVPLEEMN